VVITPEKLAKALQYLPSGPNLREAAARVKIGKTVLYQRSKSKISLVEGQLGLGHVVDPTSNGLALWQILNDEGVEVALSCRSA